MGYVYAILLLGGIINCAGGKNVETPKNYNGFEVLQITPTDEEHLQLLLDLQENHKLSFWRVSRVVGDQTMILVPPGLVESVTDYLTSSGLHVETFVQDVGSLIKEERDRIQNARDSNQGFNYDEYNTYEDIIDEMDVMVAACPVTHGILCETYVIGQSVEGRDLKVLRIYKDEPNRKIFWIDSLTHPREWMAGATALKIANHLIKHYDDDLRAKFFLSEGDWHFLFVVNPDGYKYTWDVDGDRLWRKNRSFNEGSLCRGVDLNRNFDYKWSSVGTSPVPCGGTYHGDGPASEPETQAVQAEYDRLSTDMIAMASIHSFGNYWLMPLGTMDGDQCEHMPEPDDTICHNVVNAMADDTERVHNTVWSRGNVCETIYAAAGSSMDYARAKAGVMYGFSPETRGRYGGFITPASEVQPSFEEIFIGFTTMVDKLSAQCTLLLC